MNYQDKISTIVEEALTEKTFSLDIITKIKELKDDFAELTVQNDLVTKEKDEIAKERNELSTRNTALVAQNTDYKNREVALAQKEREAEKKEYELTYQTKRGDEIKELFGIVFKNPTLQTAVYRNTQKPLASGEYMNSVSENETTTETIN